MEECYPLPALLVDFKEAYGWPLWGEKADGLNGSLV